MLEAVKEFIYRYYIPGIVHDASYNIVDTVSYALILGISIFPVLKLLQRLRVDVDRDFIRAIVPYILAGSTLRVIEDIFRRCVLEHPDFVLPLWHSILITPLIYILVFIITVILLVLSIKIGSILQRDWHRIFASMGIIWFVINLALLRIVMIDLAPTPIVEMPERIGALFLIVALGAAITLVVYLVASRIKFEYLTDRLNIGILAAHLLDASSTFVVVDLLEGYTEKHVVPTLLIDFTGTAAVMYPLKLLIFIPVIYLLDEEFRREDDKMIQNLIKLVILVLGLSPAVRNILRMAVGV